MMIQFSRALPQKVCFISKHTQEMPQLRSTAFPRHQKKERWTNIDKTNATYVSTDAEMKNRNRGAALERSVENLFIAYASNKRPAYPEYCMKLVFNIYHITIKALTALVGRLSQSEGRENCPKWGLKDCFLQPLTSCNLSKQCRP